MDLTQAYQAVKQFRDERDWAQFHSAKELANAISIESSELTELFLWKDAEDSQKIETAKREEITEEVADVATFLLQLCDHMDIDLQEAILKKLEKNALKYPVDKSLGKSDKYTEL